LGRLVIEHQLSRRAVLSLHSILINLRASNSYYNRQDAETLVLQHVSIST
jgi:hypothetical protein